MEPVLQQLRSVRLTRAQEIAGWLAGGACGLVIGVVLIAQFGV
jgi:hypothetical protein